MDKSLIGKSYLITGATSGIGYATAESLLKCGAYVLGVGRSKERCKMATMKLQLHNPNAKIDYFVADLSIQSQIQNISLEIRNKLQETGKKCLDGLLNNAGTVPFWQKITPEGFDLQWAVNHLAGFLLTNKLLDLLIKAPVARIVTVSSGSHYNTKMNWEDIQLFKRYNPLTAYKHTKLANVLFTAELDHRLKEHENIRAFAADPGLVKTDIGLKSKSRIASIIWKIRRKGGISSEESAKGIVFLLSEPSIQEAKEIYWKHCKPKAPNPFALEKNSMNRLWKISEKMCGFDK